MFCVIQEVKTHRHSVGKPKRIEVFKQEWSQTYEWKYSDEKFERPLKPSYRISIHQSYRENGKVKKKQFVVCTAGYYEIAESEFYIFDECYANKIYEIAKKLSVDPEEIYDILDDKILSVERKVFEEYRQTEEYKTNEANQRIIDKYYDTKYRFSKKYGVEQDEYKKCYDVFGNLLNLEHLEKIKQEYKQRKEYKEKSRSYQENFYDNYFDDDFGYESSSYNYKRSDSDKEILKQFYRVLSKKFHPDANSNCDTSEQMKLLNKLKNEWGV